MPILLATATAKAATNAHARHQPARASETLSAQNGQLVKLNIGDERPLRCPSPQHPEIVAVRSQGQLLSAEGAETLPGFPAYGIAYYRWAVTPWGHVYFLHRHGEIQNYSPHPAFVRWRCA